MGLAKLMPLSTIDISDFKSKGVTVIHSDCSVEAANDRSLPVDSYLVTCDLDGIKWYDIVKGIRVTIFDCYYDAFGKNVMQKMVWTDGTISSRSWCIVNEGKKKNDSRK